MGDGSLKLGTCRTLHTQQVAHQVGGSFLGNLADLYGFCFQLSWLLCLLGTTAGRRGSPSSPYYLNLHRGKRCLVNLVRFRNFLKLFSCLLPAGWILYGSMDNSPRNYLFLKPLLFVTFLCLSSTVLALPQRQDHGSLVPQ